MRRGEMSVKRLSIIVVALTMLSLVLAACGPTPEPVVVKETEVVVETVVETVVVEKEAETIVETVVVEKEAETVVETVEVEVEKEVEVVVTATPAEALGPLPGHAWHYNFDNACTEPPPPEELEPLPVGTLCEGNGHGEDGKCRAVLLNGIVANDWRIQMQESYRVACEKEPYASQFDCEVLNTPNTAEAQIAAMENLAVEGVDVILGTMAETHALNPTIEKLWDQGILFITFDIIASDEKSYKLELDYPTANYHAARWVGLEMGCVGNIIVDAGLEGVKFGMDQWQAVVAGLTHACPDAMASGELKVAGTYYTAWDDAAGVPALSAMLAAHPSIDAVFYQGPGAIHVESAWTAAGREFPIGFNLGYNANHIWNTEHSGVLSSGSGGIAIWALDTAYSVLKGEDVPQYQGHICDIYATHTDWDIGMDYTKNEIGVNAMPDQPMTFHTQVNLPCTRVQITQEEALRTMEQFKEQQ
jgi:ABC-type sugar transport system substrate-binding protein